MISLAVAAIGMVAGLCVRTSSNTRHDAMVGFLTPKRDFAGPNYGSEALDGNLERLSFADPVPEPLKNLSPTRIFGGGALVSPVNMPTSLRLEGPKRRLPDFGNAAQMFMVTRRVIDLVQSFQKGDSILPG